MSAESGRAGQWAREWAKDELRALEAAGLRRSLEALGSPQGVEIQVGAERLINFSSNDYLGLANDPRLIDAATRALYRHGVGAGASRLVVGGSEAHQALEEALCRFEESEAVLLFNSGYAANLGVLSSLAGDGDVIFSDALNHASLIDGCRLSRARTVVYPHRDVEALERLMRTTPARRRVICSDAVFSMDGHLAPLEALVALAGRYEAALVLDEAHATGVLGPSGGGLAQARGLGTSVDVRVGTLGKALGVFGAFAAAGREVTELLIHRARPLVFSTALPPALSAAVVEALRILQHDGELRARLWRNIHRFSQGLNALGFEAEPSSAIFPVVLGDPDRTVETSRRLRTMGILAKPIRPPTVPVGTSRLRFAVSARHTDAQIDQALDALRRCEVTDAAA
jgi:8-amino-7-oxononanoate synthase